LELKGGVIVEVGTPAAERWTAPPAVDGPLVWATLHDDRLDMRSASTLESKLMKGDPMPVLMDCVLLLGGGGTAAEDAEK
jgi:hypothetical protein